MAKYRVWRATRERLSAPDSSGSRDASKLLRSNSGNSSRNNTPLCASEISPGRGMPPPPMSAAPEAEWCGARNGRRIQCAGLKPLGPSDCIAAASSASVSLSAGKMPGRRLASMVLPVPGGPVISTLCAPAAATSSARLANGWPTTSAMSEVAGGCGRGPASTACSASWPFSAAQICSSECAL